MTQQQGMALPTRLEFGPGPLYWGFVGCFVCFMGLVFACFGLGLLSIDSSDAIVIVLGLGGLLTGGVCMWLGVMDVIWRHEMKIILDEAAVRIIESTSDCTISYTHIKSVRLDRVDSQLLIERVDKRRVFRLWTGHFTSHEEVDHFIEELMSRVDKAKRELSNPPADT
jgi:hypothetical protein